MAKSDILPVPSGTSALAQAVTGALVDDWLEYEALVNGASTNTITAYRRGLTAFTTWLDATGVALGDVTPMDVETFKGDLLARYAPGTVNLRLTAVRSFYRYVVTLGRLAVNPAREVKGAKRSNSKVHKRDALTGSEVRGVLDAPDTGTLAGVRDKAIVALMAFCGLRSVEIHRADIGDLRTRGDRLTLDVQGKGRKEKDEYVVIPMRAEGTIRAWLRHRLTFKNAGANDALFISLSNRRKCERLTLRGIRWIVKQHYGAAGVVGAKKSTHSLRHSAITNAIRKGATPMQVQSMARHASYDTTLGYFHEVSRLDDPAEDLISYDSDQAGTDDQD